MTGDPQKAQPSIRLVQIATFRPLGLAGRLHWYSVLPFHGLIFRGMIKKLAGRQPRAALTSEQ